MPFNDNDIKKKKKSSSNAKEAVVPLLSGRGAHSETDWFMLC